MLGYDAKCKQYKGEKFRIPNSPPPLPNRVLFVYSLPQESRFQEVYAFEFANLLI